MLFIFCLLVDCSLTKCLCGCSKCLQTSPKPVVSPVVSQTAPETPKPASEPAPEPPKPEVVVTTHTAVESHVKNAVNIAG